MTQEHLAAAAAGGLAALLLWKRCCWKRESERVNVAWRTNQRAVGRADQHVLLGLPAGILPSQ